jgi:hypothetical protein
MENQIVRVAGGGGEEERQKPRVTRKHNLGDSKKNRTPGAYAAARRRDKKLGK